MSANPTNPVLGPDHKPALGQTRGHDGNLEWFDSHTNTWRPAVRQHTIRNRLIQRSRRSGNYTYQRDGRGDDVTSFLPKDRDFGTAWAHRPPIIFQLYPGSTRVSLKPQGVLMDGNRVMLDPYDHPIRDFPELPVTLSSKERGMWIEYYMRQNKEIKPYDLMARMGKPVNGNPVRIYTLNERATKFRNTAACLSWGEKTGSAEKKAYILSLLPPGATDTRSLGGDLSKQQQEQVIAANKGRFPNRRRKSKRALEAQAPMAVPTPGFQPQAPSADGEVEGESDQVRSETEPSRLEGQDAQPTDANGLMNLNSLGSLGRGSQLGAPQHMIGQDLNIPFPAGGTNYNGYYGTQDNSSPANFVTPSQLHPSQSLPNNGGDWAPLNNPADYSYTVNTSASMNEANFLGSNQYGATYGGQTTQGVSYAAGEAQGFAALQAQGGRVVNPTIDTPVQRQKRPRATLAEDEAESHDNRPSKRVRIDAPVEAPQDASSPESFGVGEESMLRMDENGFVIRHNTPGRQGRTEAMYDTSFDHFLRETRYKDNHGEEDAPYDTDDAPATQESNKENKESLDTAAPLTTQGQKRRRSSPPEDMEEGKQGPKSKRSRREQDAQTPAESTNEASPVQVSRGQKRARGSSETRGDASSDLPTPPTKRQKAGSSSGETSTHDGDASSENEEEDSNDDDASDSSHRGSDAESDEGSEYKPSLYHQTSLKSIKRPTTGGKGPYKADGRPVTGGKGPLKTSKRANIARKEPRKQ